MPHPLLNVPLSLGSLSALIQGLGFRVSLLVSWNWGGPSWPFFLLCP